MRNLRISVAVWLISAGLVAAQTPPQLIPFNGVAPGVAGAAAMTFSIYEEPSGGVPLWVEIQSVATDANGAFTVLLGEASPPGVLAEVFASSQPHWVGVQVGGQEEQARSLLATVPYAMKAGDANTIGGLPASAFVLAGAAAGGSGGTTAPSSTTVTTSSSPALDLDSGPTTKDQVINDDLIVDGSACIGFDCVNGESFGFDTLRLKENNLRIHADDTSNSASFPPNDWRIVFNETTNGGRSKFSVEDSTAGRTPFTIEAGARANALYVEDDGDIGIGTNVPAVDVTIQTGNTPTVRLAQDGSNGFTAQTWDLAGNETNFFVRDATNGSLLPFRIRPSTPTDTIETSSSELVFNEGSNSYDVRIESNDNTHMLFSDGSANKIGIGNNAPQTLLHLRDGADTAAAVVAGTTLILESDNAASPTNYISFLSENGFQGFNFSDPGDSDAGYLLYNHGDDSMVFRTNAATAMTLDNAGNAVITGTATAAGVLLTSDVRYKRNVRTIESALDKVTRLRGVEFDWRREEFEGLRFSEGTQLGFIAQEVEDVIPEIVGTNPDGHKSVAYANVTALLIEAVKEQQSEIAQLRAQIEALAADLEKAATP